jgi:hypothetical protein
MDISWRFVRSKGRRTWIAEVWSDDSDLAPPHIGFNEPYPEEVYSEINQWCLETFGYHARTAYNIFEFKKKSNLDWFILRWQ